jgi:hypothetical protein
MVLISFFEYFQNIHFDDVMFDPSFVIPRFTPVQNELILVYTDLQTTEACSQRRHVIVKL